MTDPTTRIVYDGDRYACFVTIDGAEQYIGSASTRIAAEARCDDYALNYYLDTCTYEKAAQLVMEVTR